LTGPTTVAADWNLSLKPCNLVYLDSEEHHPSYLCCGPQSVMADLINLVSRWLGLEDSRD